MDGRFDVSSSAFDADAALSQKDGSQITLPYPEISCHRSVKACTGLVPAAVKEEVDATLRVYRKVWIPQTASVTATSSLEWRRFRMSNSVCRQWWMPEQANSLRRMQSGWSPPQW